MLASSFADARVAGPIDSARASEVEECRRPPGTATVRASGAKGNPNSSNCCVCDISTSETVL